VTAQSETEARALAFTTLVLGDVGLILTSRSVSGPPLQALGPAGKPLWAVVGGTGAFLVVLEAASPARDLFHLAALHADDVVIILIAIVLTMVGSEVARLRLRHGRLPSRPEAR
jgi:P-type Ca2+ transporter type 2C